MKRRSRDEEREQRITMEIVVDAYTPEEQAMGWYYSLEDRLHFPFVARCIAERSISPLRKLSTFVRQVGHGFVESAASLIGLLIQAAVGSSGGVGGLRTNGSGWAA